VGFTTETSFDNFQSCCASWAALLRHFCLDMGDQMEDIILVTKSVLAAPRKRMATMVQIQVMVTLTMVLGGPVRGGKVSMAADRPDCHYRHSRRPQFLRPGLRF